MKRRLPLILFTSMLILLPSVVSGLYFWDALPDPMATHFGFDNAPNGYSSKAFTVFGIPALMTALHLLCIWGTSKDRGNQGKNSKIQSLLLWLIPIISLFTTWIIYSANLNPDLDVTTPMMLLFAIVFLLAGNWMPKVRKNYIIGIRLPWTLSASGEEWDKTHRFAGRVWVACSLILLVDAFAGIARNWVLLGSLIVIAAVPIVYSYFVCRKDTGN